MVNIIICTVNSYVLWDETSLTESLFNFDIGFDNNYMDINLESIFKFFFNLLSYLDSSNIKRLILCYYNYKDRFEMKKNNFAINENCHEEIQRKHFDPDKQMFEKCMT